MTQRASDLLAEVADRLSSDESVCGLLAAETMKAVEPEILNGLKDGSQDEMTRQAVAFVQVLFRTLRVAAKVPWDDYYKRAREFARVYAERGVPLESLIEGLAVFRRIVVARVMEGMDESPFADEV